MKIMKSPPVPDPSASALQASEIFYETGELHFRFTQKRTADGSGWLREGAFEEFYQNGAPAVMGFYLNGTKNGRWTIYHENGSVVAEGYYQNGGKAGAWHYCDKDGGRADT